jgi:hypothetical protein
LVLVGDANGELEEVVVAGQLSAAFQCLEAEESGSAEKDACVVVVYSILLKISERRHLI